MLALAGNNYQGPAAPPTPTPIPNQSPIGGRPKPPTGVNTPFPVAQGPRMTAPAGQPADAIPSQVPLGLSPTNPHLTPPSSPAIAAAPLPLAAGSGSSPYASITTNTPGSASDYTDKTIASGPGVDRLALAQSNWENFAKSSAPEYDATLRDANRAAAGAGQIGSGQLRTRLGDLALARSRDLDTAKTGFLNSATEGSIGDQYNNIGIAQQQQGFQSQQQRDAYQQQLQQQQLEEMLRSGAFGRSATTLALGNSGNPSDIALQLSGYYGDQAGQAGQAAGSLLGNSALQQYLRQHGVAPGGTAGGTPYDANDPNQNIYAGTL